MSYLIHIFSLFEVMVLLLWQIYDFLLMFRKIVGDKNAKIN